MNRIFIINYWSHSIFILTGFIDYHLTLNQNIIKKHFLTFTKYDKPNMVARPDSLNTLHILTNFLSDAGPAVLQIPYSPHNWVRSWCKS